MSYYVGIDLGGTNIKVGVVDGEGKLLNKISIKTNADRAMEEIIHDMGTLAANAIKDAGLELHVWTVDDLADAEEAFRRGAQTVTTNCAKKLLDEYKAKR